MKKSLFFLIFLLILACSPRVDAVEVPFQEGDRIIIWAPEAGQALSATQSGNYSLAVTVTLEGDTLTGFGETEVWTVIQAEDGWQFTNGGQYLSMAASYSYLRLDEVHDTWTLEADGEHFTFLNQGREQLICLNSRRSQWNACTPASAARSGETALAVYVLPRENSEEESGSGIFFGQLHSHSTLSDGNSSPAELYSAASSAGLDFFAVTDHSHSFDNHEAATLADGSVSSDWRSGQEAAEATTTEDFLALFAFEMTWNQGQGHVSTFFTEGFASRENGNFQAWAGGMEAYFAKLPEGSVTQFNHPGSQYGNFKNFSAYTPEADASITLMEISGDLTPYFQALAAGWHLAPTLSGDAHSFDPAPRTAVLAEELTEPALREALQNRRTYTTTDEDLQIHFTLDGHEMGSILPRIDYPGQVTFQIRLTDPTDEAVGLVELLSEGEVLAQCEGAEEISFTVNANRDHYLLRITQPDGDWAVTAPIWLDDRDDLGIRALEAESEVLTPGTAQNFSVELYNFEEADLAISAVTLSVEGTTYLSGEQPLGYLESSTISFSHTFPVDGVYTLTASLTGTLDGREVTRHFSREFVVMPEDLVEDVILDGGHGCADGTEVLLALCAELDVAVTRLDHPATAEDLENCRLLVIPAPALDFSPEYMALVAEFVRRGGSLILCGTGVSENTLAAQRLNGLLEAIGATGRFRADDARDESNHGGDPGLLRVTDFADSLWTESLTEGQFFAQNRGCSLDPGQGQWLVRGFATGDRAVLLCAEDTASGGTVFLSGGNFLADGALVPQNDPYALPYANQTIWETILDLTRDPQDITPIARLRVAEAGRVYLIEGRVTAGTANPNTTFPDAIFVQDHTGGIEATGYAQHGLALGTRVRVLGELTGGENPAFRVLRLTELGKDSPVSPQNALLPGSLLTIEGQASGIVGDGTAVSRFQLDGVTVVVEDAIRSGSRGVNELARIVREGNALRAVGLGHWEHGQLVLRLRDCDEVWLLTGQSGPLPTEPDTDAPAETEPDDPSGPDDPDDPDSTGPDDPDSPGGSGDPADPDGENPPTGDNITLFVCLLLISGWLLFHWMRACFPVILSEAKDLL